MNKTSIAFFIVMCLAYLPTLCFGQNKQRLVVDVASFVNPFIGTANNANTYPGACLPWGMVCLSPYTLENAASVPHSASVSYLKNAPFISGFSHVSLSGVGCPDMGLVLLMPGMGKINSQIDSIKSGYSQEKASTGYYSARLSKPEILVELSATLRTGLSSYTFAKAGKAFVLLDLSRSLTQAKGAYISKVSDTEIQGYKMAGGFCGAAGRQKVYFVARIQKKKCRVMLWKDSLNTNKLANPTSQNGNNIGGFFVFDVTDGEKILIKTGISYVNISGARANLEAENPDWDFEKIRQAAVSSWQTELSKVALKGKIKEDKIIFYTGLYHALLHPNIFDDANGSYMSMGNEKKILKVRPGHHRYSVFSLWDTYRNLHALLSLIYPERASDMAQTMVDMYKESGWLPKWELAGAETYVMAGDPAVAVLAETYLKGIRDFDVKTAFKAMIHNSDLAIKIGNIKNSNAKNLIRPGLSNYLKYGYIPNNTNKSDSDFVWGSVSTTLEYNYADWCLARMAEDLGDKTTAKRFYKRSLSYKNLYDTASGFLRPRLDDGSWLADFDPTAINGELSWNPSGGPGYIEGNAWQYSWMVPHDILGLSRLMGGQTRFVERLKACFDNQHFVLWNEPDMAYPYLFNYFEGQGHHTQKIINQQIRKYFFNAPQGIPGNDDCGTLSAWLVFGMMGLYPDCPAWTRYALSTPLFDSIIIKLNPKYYSGKQIVLSKDNSEPQYIYIKQIKINKKPVKSLFISHKTLVAGAIINYKTSKAIY